MVILITGHKGFIGAHLWNSLNVDHDLIGIDLKDGQDVLEVELPDADLVIHLAGSADLRESFEQPEKYWRNNVESTERILTHYKDKRVLVASSSSIYEPWLNPYGGTKYIAESIPHDNVCFMRFTTVYSTNPREGMFFHKLFNDKLEYVTNHIRDFLHIEDLISAIRSIIDYDFVKGKFDIATGKSICIKDIIDLPIKESTPGEAYDNTGDPTFLKDKTGWEASIDINNFIFKNKSKWK
jgi:nucleoside-diphosphate-sugar epimerase